MDYLEAIAKATAPNPLRIVLQSECVLVCEGDTVINILDTVEEAKALYPNITLEM